MNLENGSLTNPLGMRQIKGAEMFVLPPTQCSSRRVEFFRRGNVILGFYSAISIASKTGQDVINKDEKDGKFKPDTPFRIKMRPSGGMAVMNYSLFKKYFESAGAHLTNQIFLMLYGNFEAYLTDLVLDALTQMNLVPDPREETLRLMYTSKWRGKFDRITQKLGVSLGTSVFVKQFRGIDMGFLGEKCNNPVEFLEKAADLRHRLVHYSSRVDRAFMTAYPRAGLMEGQTITIPFGFPMSMQLFFSHLTGVIDEAFSLKFGWKRKTIAPETLTE